MILLGVDTSGATGSLALARVSGASVTFVEQVVWTKKAMHSEVATVELQNLLHKSKVQLKDLSHLCVNVGPGSFTGLRVGLSMVKTLAYTLGLQVCALNTLEVLAFKLSAPGDKILVATKAVQNFYYVGGFVRTASGVTTTFKPQPIEFESLQSLRTDFSKVWIEGESQQAATCARDLVEVLSACGFSLPFTDWKTVEPLYLRASEAEEKLKRGLLKPV
jgi:tRNA threonylcarbamoyladenosine biosynthesis protein TsaB